MLLIRAGAQDGRLGLELGRALSGQGWERFVLVGSAYWHRAASRSGRVDLGIISDADPDLSPLNASRTPHTWFAMQAKQPKWLSRAASIGQSQRPSCLLSSTPTSLARPPSLRPTKPPVTLDLSPTPAWLTQPNGGARGCSVTYHFRSCPGGMSRNYRTSSGLIRDRPI